MPFSYWLVERHQQYKAGFLPERGGLLDQKAYYLEGMQLCERGFGVLKQQQLDELAREQERTLEQLRRLTGRG